jgi:hypothetical protein
MSKDQSEPVSRGLLAGRLGNTEPDSDAAGREQDDVLGPQVHSLTPSNAGATRLGDQRSEGSRTLATTIELVPHNTVGVC